MFQVIKLVVVDKPLSVKRFVAPTAQVKRTVTNEEIYQSLEELHNKVDKMIVNQERLIRSNQVRPDVESIVAQLIKTL